jgi:hypothetical protein
MIISDKKCFEFQAPSKNLTPLNSPKLQEDDISNLEDVFDVRLSSISKCSESTDIIYKDEHKGEKQNGALRKIDGVYDFVLTALHLTTQQSPLQLWQLQQRHPNHFTETIAYI